MSNNELPLYIKADVICKNAPPSGAVFSGEFPVEKILNLNSEFKKNAITPISYNLRFFVDGEGFAAIEGTMIGSFELTCQRCMQPMVYEAKADISVSPVSSDAQAKRLPERYEPLMMTDSEVNIAEWIAEELHLALPLVPRHDSACISHESYIQDKTNE